MEDYALRDSISAGCCECHCSPTEGADMTRTEPRTLLDLEADRRDKTHDERPSCLACGARIGSAEPTIKILGALVHMRCAVYRRREARR